MQSQVVEFRVNNISLTSLHAKIKQTYIFVYMYVYGQTNSKEWFVTLFSENPFTDLRYSTTVTFPLATFPDIFHPFFLILKSAESVLSHFPFWPASPVLLYIFHVFDTKWWFYFWGSILIFVHLIFFKKMYLWFFILYLLCSRYI